MRNVGLMNNESITILSFALVLALAKSSQRMAILPVTLNRRVQNLHTCTRLTLDQPEYAGFRHSWRFEESMTTQSQPCLVQN